MKRLQRLAAAATFLVLVVSLPACSKKSSSPAAPGGPPGGTNFNSPILQPGGSFSFTFNTAGTFGYHCGIHAAVMTGNSVTVNASSTNDSVLVNIVGTSTPGFSPSAATIKPGGTIRWVNVHSVNHSVEAD